MSPILYPHRKTRKMLQDVIVIDRIGVFRSWTSHIQYLLANEPTSNRDSASM
jgi:hypothetical protein